tara:strand:+ start:10916 stop:11761 length:846 start_codon:yes stop_codon:yes gene_type:complete
MANRMAFDPTEGPTPEQQAAETAALEQGEKLIKAQEEDRDRRMAQTDSEQEDVSLIDGKFKSQDDLLKAYKELESKLGKPKSEDEEEDSEEPVEASEEEAEESVEISENVKTFTDIATRFDEAGGLTQEDMEKLSSMDSKELIETYFKYHAVQSAKNTQEVATAQQLKTIRDSVGGDEAYGEMIQWAGQNLSPDEIESFNSVANSNNAAALSFAVEALSNRWKSVEGYEAPLVTGKKATSTGKVFRSQAELGRAIADPRYSTDPAYRQDVENKLARSGDLL